MEALGGYGGSSSSGEEEAEEAVADGLQAAVAEPPPGKVEIVEASAAPVPPASHRATLLPATVRNSCSRCCAQEVPHVPYVSKVWSAKLPGAYSCTASRVPVSAALVLSAESPFSFAGVQRRRSAAPMAPSTPSSWQAPQFLVQQQM